MEENKQYLVAGYEESRDIIKHSFISMSEDVVAIGFYLKHIRDLELYRTGGYTSFSEFAKNELGLSPSSASRYMSINNRFSIDGNSPLILEDKKGFSKSQLQEMLYLTDEQVGQATPDMTVKEIRDMTKTVEIQLEEEEPEQLPGQLDIEFYPEVLPDSYQKKTCDIAMDIPEVDVTGQETELEEEYVDAEYREIEEPEQEEQWTEEREVHDEGWFVERFIEMEPEEAEKFMEICNEEKSNGERAKKIQEYIAPYGCHGAWCSDCGYEFYSLKNGIDFQVGQEKIHMKYGRLVVELMKLMAIPDKEERSAYGLPKTEYQKNSLINVKGCGNRYSCFSCAMDCEIRQEQRNCVTAPCGSPYSCTTMNVLENLREEMGDKCQFINRDIAECKKCSHEPELCCKECLEQCGYRCRRSVESVGETEHEEPASDSGPENENGREKAIEEIARIKPGEDEDFNCPPGMEVEGDGCTWKAGKFSISEGANICEKCWMDYLQKMILEHRKKTVVPKIGTEETGPEQPELPRLKNNEKRKEWIGKYKDWGVWYQDENIGAVYYKYDFEDGSRIVVSQYRNTRVRFKYGDDDGLSFAHYHLIKNGQEFSPYDTSETELVEFLKTYQQNHG